MILGSNVLWSAYWGLPQTVDISLQCETPYILPKKNDGSDDWENAVAVETDGRIIRNQLGKRIRFTVSSDPRILYSQPPLTIALIWRGQATVRCEGHDLVKRVENVPLFTRPATVDIYQLVSNHQLWIDVLDCVEFELIAIVETENLSQFLSRDIIHPIQQLVWNTLGGYRRMMDWCGLGSKLEHLDNLKRFSYSNQYYRPGQLRRLEELKPTSEAYTHAGLLLLPEVMRTHRGGSYWICLPSGLNDDALRDLGTRFASVWREDDVIEFSNELWNESFAYTRIFQSNRPSGMHAAEWYLREALRRIKIFESGLQKQTRRVACWQADGGAWAFGRDWNGEPSIPWVHEHLREFDAIAIAPYLFSGVAEIDEASFLTEMVRLQVACASWKRIAIEHRKPLWAYEGLNECPGEQHRAVRESPWMGTKIFEYLKSMEAWFEHFCVYTGMGPVWGLLEGYGGSLSRANGVLKYVRNQGSHLENFFSNRAL